MRKVIRVFTILLLAWIGWMVLVWSIQHSIMFPRNTIGPDRLLGRSTHALSQLHQAEADGCDYVGGGPLHATPTKPGREPVGLDYLRQAAAEANVPFFAIGGVDASTLPAVMQAGGCLCRVAVVRAVMEADDPAAATSELLEHLRDE